MNVERIFKNNQKWVTDKLKIDNPIIHNLDNVINNSHFCSTNNGQKFAQWATIYEERKNYIIDTFRWLEDDGNTIHCVSIYILTND